MNGYEKPITDKKVINRWLLELEVFKELARAYEKHGQDPWGRHEFYAILKEEVEELWDIIKSDGPTDTLVREMAQVAAMVFRYAETGNRYGNTL